MHIQRGSRSPTLCQDEWFVIPASLSPSPLCFLSLARAVCSAVPLSDRIYPRWAAQLTPLICLCEWVWVGACVCAYLHYREGSSHCPPPPEMTIWRHTLITRDTLETKAEFTGQAVCISKVHKLISQLITVSVSQWCWLHPDTKLILHSRDNISQIVKV